MKIIYRISDSGYNKIKPNYINNEACLLNALDIFSTEQYNWLVIADNVSEATKNKLLFHHHSLKLHLKLN
jgi:hypothetical protein